MVIIKVVKKFQNMDIVAKASFIYVLTGFSQRGISVISGPIFTRLLSQEAYGMLSVFNSCYEMVGIVAMLSLSTAVYNNGLLEHGNDRDVFTFSLLVLSNIATLITMVLVLGSYQYISNFLNIPVQLMPAMFVSFLFSPAFSFWIARQRYEYKYKLSCVVTVVQTFLSVGVSVLITYFTGSLTKKIYYEKAVLLFFWLILYLHIAYRAKFRVKVSYWFYALKINFPLIPHYLSNYILNSMDRLMISSLVGSEEAAIYAVAYSASFLVTIFWQSVNAAILPFTYESINRKAENDIPSKTIPYLALYGIICITVSFVAPEMMFILAPSSYCEGVYIIPILLIGVFLTGLYCLFANVEFYYKSTKIIAFNSLFSAILNIILNYIFIKKIGYKAAAYTTVVCYMMQTALHYINYRRVSKKIYNECTLLILVLGVFIGCIMCIPVYDNLRIRYIILSVIICIACTNKKYIIKLYSGLKKK